MNVKRYQGTPHDTGEYVSDYRLMKDEMTTAALWVDKKDEDAHYNFRGTANADGDEEPETRTYIIGPTTLAFPINKGWAPAVQNPDPQYAIEELADLTIKRVTKLITVTEQIKNNRPNCEEAWALRVGFTPPFDEIWPSLGTPLSDATEEPAQDLTENDRTAEPIQNSPWFGFCVLGSMGRYLCNKREGPTQRNLSASRKQPSCNKTHINTETLKYYNTETLKH